MGIVNRGFQGRPRQRAAGLIPPGQYLTEDFPVLSAGPTPRVTQDQHLGVPDHHREPLGDRHKWSWDQLG